MTLRTLAPLAALVLVVLGGCGPARPGDSGGARIGDGLDAPAAGSARVNDSLERRRPADTTAAAEVHDARGRDTSGQRP